MVSGVNATVAYVHEPTGDYRAKSAGSPTDTDMKIPGTDTTIDDISIDNALTRLRTPGNAEAAEILSQTFEGAFDISFKLGNPWWHNEFFGKQPTAGGESEAPYTYTWTFDPAHQQSARWYVGVDWFSQQAERELKGVVYGGLQISCQVGNPVEVQLTGFYADEEHNTSFTPSSTPEEQADPLIWPGTTLDIPNSTKIQKIQDLTLDIQTGTRPMRSLESRKPVDAVMGAVETELTVTDVVTTTDQLALAYGNSNAPAESVGEAATGTLRFESAPSSPTALEYQLTGLTPNSYSWQNIGNADEDITEDVTYYVETVTAKAESAQSSAR